MLFQEGRYIPLWTTPQEHVATKFGQYDDMQLKDKTDSELLGNLKRAGVYIYVVKGNRVGDMQDIYCKKMISVTNRISK